MLGVFNDGLTAASWPAHARVDGDLLVFEAADRAWSWPLADIEAEAEGRNVRLSLGHDARLTLPAEAWRAATRPFARRIGAGPRRRARRIAVGVGALSLGIGLLIFFGVPLAAGPLAAATPRDFEQQLGHNFQTQLQTAFPSCDGAAGQAALQGLARRLQAHASSPFEIRVQAVDAPIANAFALPGGAVLVTDDLIEMAGSGDELAAVIAHEIAHVERRHVMRAVWRNAGLGVMLDLLVGGGGAGQQAVMLAGAATNLSFSRTDEAEADARGMALLRAAGLSSTGMAGFFDKVAKDEGENAAALELISSHPDAARRAQAARAAARGGARAFSPAEWRAIKAACAVEAPSGAPAGRRQASLPRLSAE